MSCSGKVARFARLAGRLICHFGRFGRFGRLIMHFGRLRKANHYQKTGKGIVTTCYKDDAKIG